MNDYIYVIYDKLSGRYGSPFAACNDMVAARLALMIKGGYNKAFDGLFRIGIFSNSSGEIEGCEPVNISETVEEVLEMLKSAQEKQEEEKHE
jgi:hypothetical protein